MKENCPMIAILNNNRFLKNAFESQLLTKYEKPGKTPENNLTRKNFFFAVNSCWELRTRGK